MARWWRRGADLVALAFGRWQWQPPPWAQAVARRMAAFWRTARAQPRRTLSAGLAVLAFVLLVGLGWQWWASRPRPPEPPIAGFEFQSPPLTDYASDPVVVHPLRVAFDRSVAPLAEAGQSGVEGFRLRPEIAGNWTWESDRLLVFQPTGDWPIGERYRVDFDHARAFAPSVRVLEPGFEFTSAPLTASLGSAEFHQDPLDPDLKKAIVRIDFSHAVDPVSLQSSVRLDHRVLVADGKPVARDFSISYDRDRRSAFVHSERLDLSDDAALIRVRLAAGVRAAAGGRPTETSLEAQVEIPGRFGLQVAAIEPVLVDNDRFETEQVLRVGLSLSVGEAEMVSAVRAWLLPIHDPELAEHQRRSATRWSVGQVTDRAIAAGQPLDLELLAGEQVHASEHAFRFRADPGRYLLIRVERGLTSFGGYVLGKTDLRVLRVPNFPSVLRFMADGALLSLSGDRRIGIVARDVPGARLEVARVLPDQLHHLVASNYGSFERPSLYGSSSDQSSERFERIIDLAGMAAGEVREQGVDLSDYLGPGGRRGVFLLNLHPHDPAQAAQQASEAARRAVHAQGLVAPDEVAGLGEGWHDGYIPAGSDSRLVVVTDLGVALKRAFDGSLDVFVQSIASGQPVAGATVEVIGRNGQRLVSAGSDSDGRARFASLQGFTREKRPLLLQVRRGEDLSFLPLDGDDRQLDYSRFDIGGIRNARVAGQLSAHLFSDRGIYRPGERFNIGILVRADDWGRSLAGLPLQVDIVDARGMRVQRTPIRLPESGFEEVAFQTLETSPTGEWTVNLVLVRDDNRQFQLGSTTVRVREFLPDRMKASVRFSRPASEGWLHPDGLAATVSLRNLFGTPAQDRRVEATLTLTPTLPAFPSHPGYRFHVPGKLDEEGYSEPFGDLRTNADGEVEFPLGLEKFAGASYRVHLFARGFEAAGGRGVAAEAATLVSTADYLVGIKADGGLDHIPGAAKRSVRLLAIDPQAHPRAVENLRAVRVERRYVSVLTRQDSGAFKYESRLRESVLDEAPLSLPSEGLDWPLATARPGRFALLVRDARGRELNRVEYDVAGDANLSRSLERNAELQLSLSKSDYAAGEEIEIAIRAPYAGTGLITIERERVYAHAWFKAETTASVQRIRVPSDLEGNGYVNVQFLRDPASDEIFMSPLSHGIVPFTVDRGARRTALRIDAPDRVRPGEALAVTVQTERPTRLVLFAVDEGILQVARYRLTDPLDRFFAKRMLEVRTRQILDLMLPEFARLNMRSAPGGDAEGLLGRHLNPFRGKRVPPVAYWSGLIEVDGQRTLSYTVPDHFSGRLRVMAVAATPDSVGIAETATTVRGDFVLSPNVPTMVAPGDEFDISVGVANTVDGLGERVLPIALSLDLPEGLSAVEASQGELSLAAEQEGVLRFRLRAGSEPGPARLRFRATAENYTAAIEAELSVRPATAYHTETTFGRLDREQREITPLRTLFAPFAQHSAAISHSPLVVADGLGRYLSSFEHQCTEQVLSRAVPAMVFERRPEYAAIAAGPGRPGAPAKSHADAFADLLGLLAARQNGEGAIGYWRATVESEPWVTAYAMLYLIEARERGLTVPDDLLRRATGYLQRMAADEGDASLAGLRERAFAIYLLTRQRQVTGNLVAALRERLQQVHGDAWQSDLAAAYLAASLALMKEDREADRLMAGPKRHLSRRSRTGDWTYARFHDPLIADAGVLYLLARHFPEQAAALPAQALDSLIEPIRDRRYNTVSSALTVLALDAYSEALGSSDGRGLSLAWRAEAGPAVPFGTIQGAVLAGAFDPAASAVRVGNELDRPAWYGVSQTGFDREPVQTALAEGIEVVREWLDADGRPVETVALGDEIQVRIKVRSTRPGGVGDVAIVDPLPGGFEPVLEAPPEPAESNPDDGEFGSDGDGDGDAAIDAAWSRLASPGWTWQAQHVDIRDDRVVLYGWVDEDMGEFVYRIRATNSGRFVVPALYAESMYERTVRARSAAGTIVVEAR